MYKTLLCLVLALPLTAKAEEIFPLFVVPWAPSDLDGNIFIVDADLLLPSYIVDAYAPGSQMRVRYEELRFELATEGYLAGFRSFPCDDASGLQCFGEKREYLSLPDATPFFDHHYRGLSELYTRLLAAPAGPSPSFKEDLVELRNFQETHAALHEPTMFMFSFKKGEQFVEELYELLSRRHFLIDQLPTLEFALTSTGNWQPEMGAISVPFFRPENDAHKEVRRVRFSAINTGEDIPFDLRFEITGETPFRVLPGQGVCRGQEPTICETPVSPTGNSIELELGHPEFGEDVFHAFPSVTVALSGRTDQGWQPLGNDQYAMQFSRCDAEYANAIAPMGTPSTGLIGDARRALWEETLAVSGLPGRLLFQSFSLSGDRLGIQQPGEGNGWVDLRTANEVLTGLVNRRLLDDLLANYWSGNNQISGRGLDDTLIRIPVLRKCDRTELDQAYIILDRALSDLETKREYYERLLWQAERLSDEWNQLANRRLSDFADDQIFETTDKSGARQVGELAGATVAGALTNGLAGVAFGADYMATFGARANAIGAIMATLQTLSAAYDLVVLDEIEDYVNEAIAWHEASAYFRGMVDRYVRVEEHLQAVREMAGEADRKYCTCYRFPNE